MGEIIQLDDYRFPWNEAAEIVATGELDLSDEEIAQLKAICGLV